ncbi:Zinc finger, RING-type [Dillenia turbinata]|uniref:Zinc finger, RING-type n=1 Tax=Dillenia turbinata TaxID=194707 RepID=A0AAN8VKF5_9MAGN
MNTTSISNTLNTTDPPTNSDSGGGESEASGGLGNSIGVSLGVLLLIIVITLASYICTRIYIPTGNSSHRTTTTTTTNTTTTRLSATDLDTISIDHGLDESTIMSYPKLLYSQVKIHKGNNIDPNTSCCSICLGDYKETDLLRLLPDCGHLFHVKCVDPWLRLHPTCPICRNSPLPTPLTTPLAEVAPLASRRD